MRKISNCDIFDEHGKDLAEYQHLTPILEVYTENLSVKIRVLWNSLSENKIGEIKRSLDW